LATVDTTSQSLAVPPKDSKLESRFAFEQAASSRPGA
jgi:hypothetical protein